MKYLHVAFAFTKEDKELLVHCAGESGLTQTELIRRLLRHYGSGRPIEACPKIKPDKRAVAWVKARAG